MREFVCVFSEIYLSDRMVFMVDFMNKFVITIISRMIYIYMLVYTDVGFEYMWNRVTCIAHDETMWIKHVNLLKCFFIGLASHLFIIWILLSLLIRTFRLDLAIRWSREFSASPGGFLPQTANAIRVYVYISTSNGNTNCKTSKAIV